MLPVKLPTRALNRCNVVGPSCRRYRRLSTASASGTQIDHHPISYEQLQKVALSSAEAGAEIVRAALDKPRNIEFKGATDLVTDTDKAAEVACLSVIQKTYPDHMIIGEEGGIMGGSESDYLWCIDPIDGTTNFAHSYPSFAVSVGVLRNSVPVAACVIEFTGGPQAWGHRTFTAFRNGGSRCNGAPIAVSATADLQHSLLVTGFGYDHDEAWATNMDLFKHFTDKTQGVRRLGAAAVDLCHVAMGLVDAYWEYRLKPWDVCAGVLVLEEAGGMVTTMRGTDYSVFERSMLASNDRLHSQLLETIEPATDALLSDGIELGPWLVPAGYKLHGRR